jgi:hypothetical protein
MADKNKEDRRSSVGFGSTYRKGRGQDLGSNQEIGSVVGGQVWLVKPDKQAKASNPCLWMQAGVVKFKNCDNTMIVPPANTTMPWNRKQPRAISGLGRML